MLRFFLRRNNRVPITMVRTFNTMKPPPPPPEPANVSTRRNMALGTFFIFGGLMYYWNKNGDLLDGATLEDPVQGIPAPGGPINTDNEEEEEEESDGKPLSASQRIRIQVAEDKKKEMVANKNNIVESGSSSNTVTDIQELKDRLTFLRSNENNLRKFLKANDDGGVVCTRMKEKIQHIENEKASIKTIIKKQQKQNVNGGSGSNSSSFFVYEKISSSDSRSI